MELAVGRAEARLADERGEVGRGRLPDRRRQCALAQRVGELARARRQPIEVRRHVAGRGPGVLESRAVVVADRRAALAGRRGPAAAVGRAVGKPPGDEEGVLGALARRDPAVEADGGHASRIVGLGAHPAVRGEVVPEVERARPPAGARPAAEDGDLAGVAGQRPQANRPGQRVIVEQRRIRHQHAVETFALDDRVLSRIGQVARHAVGEKRVLDRPGNRHVRRPRVRVGDRVAEDGHRQPGVVRVVRDERREGVETDVHAEPAVVEVHAGQRELAGEGGALQALEAGRAPRSEPPRPLVGRRKPRFEHAHERRA